MTDPATLTAAEQVRRIRSGDLSPLELMDATLARVRTHGARLNAFLTLTEEAARSGAERADAAVRSGAALGPLHGVPFALKDNFETRGVRTTAGSRVLEDFVPDRDATVVERLSGAGGILLGKTLLSEFACANPVFGDMPNPWNLEHVAGYSSGGSAAAVAARLCPLATGHDTGGSIRIPASFSGIVGLKPTYGRVSRRGVLPFAWSLDHAGPLTRSVEDAALMLQVIAGYDPGDPTSSRAGVPDYRASLDGEVKGLRLGVPREWFFDLLDEQVERGVREGVAVLEGVLSETHNVSMPGVGHALEIAHPIQWSEAAAYHEEHLEKRSEKYGPELLQMLRAGRLIPAVDYLRAQRLRRSLREEMHRALTLVDVLVTPTTPVTAPRLDATEYAVRDRPVSLLYAAAAFTLPFNLSGLPAISLPCGFDEAGLPIGMQLVGRPFEEATLLRVARAYERATHWHEHMPPVDG